MNKVQRKSGTSKKAARDRRILAKARREEVPVSAGIARATARAGIEHVTDSTWVTFVRGDVEYMIRDLEVALEDVLDADDCVGLDDCESERAVSVLSAVQRIRLVRSQLENRARIAVPLTGGAS